MGMPPLYSTTRIARHTTDHLSASCWQAVWWWMQLKELTVFGAKADFSLSSACARPAWV
jgi:hypothetical protein